MAEGWTITEAVGQLHPPIRRWDLARALRHVEPVGVRHGRLGRKAAVYPIAEIMRVHAEWVRDRA
jgi:hypothetical protein